MDLLKIKLYKPSPRPDLVPRPHLVAALEAGLKGKLTLLSAPAGFGKTTLLAEWVRQTATPVAWLALEEADSDRGRFLAYLIAALQSVRIEVAPQLTSLLGGAETVRLETLLIPLINQIAETKGHYALVLDDYHLILSPEVHEILAYLLDHWPPNLHLVIAGRADPPLPLARLRARGELTEIRERQLRFSMEESAALIETNQGPRLSFPSIRALVERTGGWAAALQMVVLSLKGELEPDQYIREISGGQDYIADFFSAEVIDRQPDEIQRFLLMTSILDRLSGPLCDALTGMSDGAGTLKKLRDENLFLFSLDDESRWFRYHRLFADLLQQQLLDTQAERVADLYLSASRWHETAGLPGEAIEYALRGGHADRAGTLIEAAAEETLIRSEIATFLRWVEHLPKEAVEGNPALAVYAAWAVLLGRGEPDAARAYLASVEPADEPTSGQINAVGSLLAQYDRDSEQAIALGRRAMAQLPEADFFFRSIAAWNLSASLFISGDTAGGQEMLEALSRTSRASGNLLVAIIAECRLAAIKLQFGDLYGAEAQYKEALALAAADQEHPLPVASEAMMGLGKIYWEWGENETARQWLEQGVALSRRWREVTALDSATLLAHLSQIDGDAQAAGEWLARAEDLARRHTATESDDRFVASQRAQLAILGGDLEAAERWGSREGFEQYLEKAALSTDRGTGGATILRYELIIYARLLMARDRYREALGILDLILPDLEAGGHRLKTIEVCLLRAICFQNRGTIDAASLGFAAAVQLAEQGGYVRVFQEAGRPVVALLEAHHAQGRASDYTRRLLARLAPETSAPDLPDWVDPLSEREIQVLRRLDSDQAVPEIADELYITVSTLRTHVRNIYSKLRVHSRYEAVARGRELDLI